MCRGFKEDQEEKKCVGGTKQTDSTSKGEMLHQKFIDT
jgi:hypothetical protein